MIFDGLFKQEQQQSQGESPYSRMLEDPKFALGYGLLTSRENPLGAAVQVMGQGETARQGREDNKLKNMLMQAQLAKALNPQPKLQFNPVSGDMFDMRTGLPYNAAGGQGAPIQGGNDGYKTSFEMPLENMAVSSSRGRIEAEKANIAANAPLTKKEKAQIDLDERRVQAMEAGNEREQQKAVQEQKTIENQNKTLLNFLDKKEAAIDRLLSPKSGLTSATGFIQSKLPTISQATREAEKDLELIRSMETLDAASMNILKGVLSDTDMALLTAAASGELDLERADATVINSLVRIKNEIGLVKQRLGGKAALQPNNNQSQISDPLGIR
jgi:hypothetical protein